MFIPPVGQHPAVAAVLVDPYQVSNNFSVIDLFPFLDFGFGNVDLHSFDGPVQLLTAAAAYSARGRQGGLMLIRESWHVIDSSPHSICARLSCGYRSPALLK
ncbi:hypothetical protein D3C81_1932030 [compost metagenome]